MKTPRAEFAALYLTRFASSFGFVTLTTLLPTYIDPHINEMTPNEISELSSDAAEGQERYH